MELGQPRRPVVDTSYTSYKSYSSYSSYRSYTSYSSYRSYSSYYKKPGLAPGLVRFVRMKRQERSVRPFPLLPHESLSRSRSLEIPLSSTGSPSPVM
jgi:hypothetical protein